jgi:hypothetical protein
MDELHAMEAGFGKKVHDNLASLLNLKADLLFPARPPRILRPGTPVRCCPAPAPSATPLPMQADLTRPDHAPDKLDKSKPDKRLA